MGMSRPPLHPAGAESLTIAATGATLAARLFLPPGPPRAAAVLHGATGVPMGFYRAFAEWLAADRGVAVLTYDYRDFGASARAPTRASRATMADWGFHDQGAALQTLTRLFPGTPRWVIGQSLGGLFLAFHPEMAGVARVITVNSGPVHVTDHPHAFRALARVFWHGPHRALTRALGYHPGRHTGLGADLPRGVWEDWRRWCLTPGFFLSDLGHRLPFPDPSRVTAEMRLVATADDHWVPTAAVWRLMRHYPEAVKCQLVLHPAAFGLARLGHLGPLARANALVWPALVD
ncbi:MAG: alpha/beta hydrolase [Rhodobacteraceae bacterium]|nr:alpha/beta hydrolase [Paracoccaceae bacterium]